ncbi:zinc finger CCHC domain-containing protein 9-like [Tribolium madens]|uniref:zinc finger CCHC domain-containing protein 9-like n=1 Tax=Tribolium madens TaxID=41895 RepID=UPI001CF75B39|nr:zinc finger CCHC domain-containing protein 9-like [Tribolium madens]
MTRFARAKGSKASNERVPEDATSWSEMKNQLLEKNQETKKRHEADKQRETNYKAFLQQVENDEIKNSKWAEFPVDKPKKKKILKILEEKSGIKRKSDSPLEENNKKAKKPTENGASNEAKPAKKIKKKNKPNILTKKEPLTEEEQKKIEKKKEKRLRQLEKKKLKQPQVASVKKAKPRDNEKHERRKKPQNSMIINGKEVEIAYVDGFPIKIEDAERIRQLRQQMISKGLPRSEIKIALKLERRKAEKAFAREKKKVCFNCRKSGHNLSECPELGKQIAESSGTGICFKCGSTEHTHFECKVVRGQEFKFAQCFICREQGHIARQCPDNARGLYPKGGACKVCGDVTHLKKDCPKYQIQQQQLQDSLQIDTITGSDNPDDMSKNDENSRIVNRKPNKVIKFYLCLI